jgi:hypothetical protein
VSTFGDVATGTVLGGNYIPAHDATFDIAEAIGRHLDAFQAYVTEVRDAEQANNAVHELLAAFTAEAEKKGPPPAAMNPFSKGR